MSSAHRSWSQRREDRMAATVRTPEDNERARIEGLRSQAELIDEAEDAGILTREQANEYRAKYGHPTR